MLFPCPSMSNMFHNYLDIVINWLTDAPTSFADSRINILVNTVKLTSIYDGSCQIQV